MRYATLLLLCLSTWACATDAPPAPVPPPISPIRAPEPSNPAPPEAAAPATPAPESLLRPAPWRRLSVPKQGACSSGFWEVAVDGDPTTVWNPRAQASAEAPQWLALPLERPARGALGLHWVGHALHYQRYANGRPRTYAIEVSADSTDGHDGTWRAVARVEDNLVRSRVDRFEAPGARWVRMRFEDTWSTHSFEPFIREVEVLEAQREGASDVWLFLGDSVTSVGFDPEQPQAFADVVAKRFGRSRPIALSGGIGGDEAANALERLAVALPSLPERSVVTLCYGTNDASRDVPLDAFEASLQAAIDAIRAAGHQPLLAVTPWNLNGRIDQYAEVCRRLAAKNGLPPGPDFHAYFRDHPEELQVDRVHPRQDGRLSMQRLWAEAAGFRYAEEPPPASP